MVTGKLRQEVVDAENAARHQANSLHWLDSEDGIRTLKAFSGAIGRLVQDDLNSECETTVENLRQIYYLATAAEDLATSLEAKYGAAQ